MLSLQKPVLLYLPVICSQCFLLAYLPVSARVQFLPGVRGEGAWRNIVLWWVDMIALQKPVSHPVICSQCLLLAHLPVSAMGAISTGSTWRRSLEINCAMVSWHDSLAETCFSSRYLQPLPPVGLLPVPAGVQFLLGVRGEGAWRVLSLVSGHDSLAETCFSSRYLQPVPPVGLPTGFSNGCNFYWEYVEEPGD